MKAVIFFVVVATASIAGHAQDAFEKSKMVEQSIAQDSIAKAQKLAEAWRRADSISKLPPERTPYYKHNNFRSKTNAGISLIALGTPSFAAAFYCRYRTIPDPEKFLYKKGNTWLIDTQKYNSSLRRYKARWYGLLTGGCFGMGVGSILLALGVHDQKVYFRQSSASIQLSDNGLGIAFNF